VKSEARRVLDRRRWRRGAEASHVNGEKVKVFEGGQSFSKVFFVWVAIASPSLNKDKRK
jgi:hypothetical protein